MSENTPLVSVGILCFNAQDTILDAIESALDQTYINKEVIVLDDFSSDNSFNKISKSIYKDKIKLFRNKKNFGIGYSRNKIFELSQGDFICFMDDDDISDKRRIEMQVNSILNYGFNKNDNVLSICNIEKKYISGYKKYMKVFGINGRKPNPLEMKDFLLFNKKNKGVDYGFGCPTCAMLISKKSLETVGGFDENLRRVEDMDLTIRLADAQCNFIGSNINLVKQFDTSGNDKLPINNLKSEIQIIKKHKRYLKEKRMYIYTRTWPYLRYYYFQKNYFLLLIFLIFLIFIKPNRTIKHFLKSALNRLKHDIKKA